jgi:hypothetical protein
VFCHQPGASAHSFWDARLTTPLRRAGIVDGRLYNNPGDTNNRVVKPGSLEHSILLSRVAQLGKEHMPPVAASELDTEAIQLLREWILQDLTNSPTYGEWQQSFFGSTNAPAALPEADPDLDGASNHLEFLTGCDPLDGVDVWKIGIQRTGGQIQIVFPQEANRLLEVQFTTDFWPTLVWRPLDVWDNRPYVAASNRVAIIRDSTATNGAKMYRVRVSEP